MQHGKLAILVGGGPAPGINSVIGAATIRTALQGVEVLGIQDGFERLMRDDTSHVRPLRIDEVSRIHFRGGSIIGTSRANPTKEPKHLDAVLASLDALGVTRLITIGGDDTAFSAFKLAERARDRLQVVHVPKTIDNDLDLPPDIDTFGFQTARHVGAEIVKNIMVDAFTTSRWYFVISMGRKAGHLALGIGKAAGATLTLIPEEFGESVPMRRVVDTLVGAIIKRQADGRRHGVAVIAEGVVLSIDEKDLGSLDQVERDEHGHVRIAEINVGEILQTRGEEGARGPRDQDDRGSERCRLRAALRRSDTARHGVHARPRLLRGEVHPRRRHGGDGVDARRAVRADSVLDDDRSGHGADAREIG